MAAIGQDEGKRAQIEEMAAETCDPIGLAGCRALGDLIDLIGLQRSGKAHKRAFTVDVLDRDARAVLVNLTLAVLVLVVPERQRKAAGKATACSAKCDSQPATDRTEG